MCTCICASYRPAHEPKANVTRTSSADGSTRISDDGYGECECQDHYVSLRVIWNSTEFAEMDWFKVHEDDRDLEFFICRSHARAGAESSCGDYGFFYGDIRMDAFIGDDHLDLCSYHINASCPSNSLIGSYPPEFSDYDECPDLIVSGWTDVMGHDCDDGFDVCSCDEGEFEALTELPSVIPTGSPTTAPSSSPTEEPTTQTNSALQCHLLLRRQDVCFRSI